MQRTALVRCGSFIKSAAFSASATVEFFNVHAAASRRAASETTMVCAGMTALSEANFSMNFSGISGGTAGMHMLQVLQREGLYNIVCVVTRYFGGILLGAGGLVRAYTKGAKIAVDAAGKSMKRVWTVVYMPIPYTYYERVRLEVANFGGIIRDTQFGAEVELELLFPEANVQDFFEKITDMTAGTVEGMETGQEYKAFPV